ncbi:hypothetical protein [Actinomadura sp. DC4]|uniref:hypothetical protein n=1 Tax=Actinomadura sp. DC4 TaxID=3055069 RepID=UPI0025B27742|nr:hypothetical protein [Actinomadura sp. DC4]MDN3355486.1 hypothetical protein [Actinomadura sp. DC4]
MERDRPSNEVRGDVLGNLVQAGHIHGGVHIHRPARKRPDGPVVAGPVPQRPPAFQPRTDLREEYDRLTAAGSTTVAFTGLRGIGKTQLAAFIEVGVFTDEESLALLDERTALADDPNARALAEEVGHLPLALAQSAAVIRRQRLTYPEFVERLRAFPVRDYLSRGSGDPYPVGAAAAILLSFASVEGDDARVAALTEILALLSPAGVARELVRETGTAAEIDDLLGVLAEASLLTFGIDGATVFMHRFVQRIARDRARMRGTLATAALDTARLLYDAVAARAFRVRPAEEIEGLGQQISALWAAVAQDVSGDWEAAAHLVRLRAAQVTILMESREPGKAVDLGETACADGRRILGPEHPETLRARNNLAGAYGRPATTTVRAPCSSRISVFRPRPWESSIPTR